MRISTLAWMLVGVAVLQRVAALQSTASSTANKQFVCTETFKAGLTSFFTQKDTKTAFAEDTTELCEMCAKVVRLAYLYSNDMTTSATWATALQNNACKFVGSARTADCNALTTALVSSRRKFFDGKKSKFTRGELRGSTEQLGLLVDTRSYKQCKSVGCCPIVTPRVGKASLQPCSKPGDKAEVAADRDALVKDRFYMDKLRDELFEQRRDNNKFKAKLHLHEVDLKGREKKLKKQQNVLKQDQAKMGAAVAALKIREARVARRENDEKEFERYNKKQEKWLKDRSDLVKDREDICYKREEQLGIPHPPTSRPPPPPAPPTPITRPPSF